MTLPSSLNSSLGLKDAVQDMLALTEEPDTFAAFREKAIEIDKRQYARYLEKQQSGSGSSARPNPTSTLSRPRAPTTPAPLPSTPLPPRPSMAMDLSQARHLSPEEKKRRQEQNLCFYCASPDHMSKGCPNKISKSTLANAYVGDYSDTETVAFDLGKDDA